MKKRYTGVVRLFAATVAITLLLTRTGLLFPEENQLATHTTFFNDNAGLGVKAPSFQFIRSLGSKASLAVQYTLDRVGIPPLRGISGIPLPTDAITGASRPVDDSSSVGTYFKNRNQFIGQLTLDRFSFTGYYSTEIDYQGRLVGAGYNKDFNMKNTNIAVGFAYGWDDITPTGQDTAHTRRSYLANIAVTQSLSPTSIMRIGVDLTLLRGFQTNPYRTVNVDGGYYLENHPLSRTRVAGYVKLNKYFKRANAALWLDYRLYADDWGLISHTAGIKFYQNITQNVLVRYRYRYYTQNSVWFYQKEYPLQGRPVYYTADYKLKPFQAQLFGFKIVWQAHALNRFIGFAHHTELDFKIERFFTSESFGANIMQTGMTFHF